MINFLLLQKLARVPLKDCFSYCIKKMSVKPINSSIEVVYIWTIAGFLSNTHSSGFRWFLVVSCGFRWLSLIIAGYPWLSLVILGYPWLSLVILGYPWLSLVTSWLFYQAANAEDFCKWWGKKLQTRKQFHIY